MGIIKKSFVIFAVAAFFVIISFSNAYGVEGEDTYAPENTQEPVTEVITQEPVTETVTVPPETESEIYDTVTEPETYEPETEAVTDAPYTEPETENAYTEPETTQAAVGYIEDTTHDISQLPTLVDSTQVAEELPDAVGADSESGGVSFIGGVVCWICVGVAVAVILAFLLSTTGKNKTGIGRYDTGNKFGGSHYGGNVRYR